MEQSDSIITELLQDIESKDKIIHSLSNPEEEEFLSSEFTILRSGKKVVITGVALAEGTWMGKFYDRKDIKLSTGTLAGCKMDVEHSKHPSWGGTIVGKVTAEEWHDKLNALLYVAEITDEQMAQEVLAGHWKGVSVMIARNHYHTDDGRLGCKDIKYVRLSLTKFPACKLCQVLSVTEEELANIPQLLKEQEQELQTGEASMTNEENLENTEETETLNQETTDAGTEGTPDNEAGIKPIEIESEDPLGSVAGIINTEDSDSVKLESITKLLQEKGAISHADVKVARLQKDLEVIKAALAKNEGNGETTTQDSTDESTDETEETETEDPKAPDKTKESTEEKEATDKSKDEETTVTDDKTKEADKTETSEETTETTDDKTTDKTEETTDKDETTKTEDEPTLEQIIDTEGRTLDDDASTATRLMIEAIQRGEW